MVMRDDKIATILKDWIDRRVTPAAREWLAEAVARTAQGDRRGFLMSFSMASRKVGKDDLGLTGDELQQGAEARPGWDASRWTLDQASRSLLILHWPQGNADEWTRLVDTLFAASDVGELVALYQSMPLWPFPESHRLRAAEGIRSNMRAVFEAVAHRNPYPAEQLEEGSWNQMVLKCLFIGARLAPVVGLDQRANQRLAEMLWDYSKERRAAHRSVSPELWRCVGPFAVGPMTAELTRLVQDGEPLEREAARRALGSGSEACQKVAAGQPGPAMTWEEIARRLDEQEAA